MAEIVSVQRETALLEVSEAGMNMFRASVPLPLAFWKHCLWMASMVGTLSIAEWMDSLRLCGHGKCSRLVHDALDEKQSGPEGRDDRDPAECLASEITTPPLPNPFYNKPTLLPLLTLCSRMPTHNSFKMLINDKHSG